MSQSLSKDIDVAATFQYCEKQHLLDTASEGGQIVVCDRAFPSLPYIRTPAVQRTGNHIKFTGVYVDSGTGHLDGKAFSDSILMDADGRRYKIMGNNGNVLTSIFFAGLGSTGSAEDYLPGMGMPSFQYLQHLYEFEGTVVEEGGGGELPVVKIERARRSLRISTKVLATKLLGAWEGWTTGKVAPTDEAQMQCPGSPRCFSSQYPVPIRVTFDRLFEEADPIFNPFGPEWSPFYFVMGQIENLDGAAKFRDGTCHPSTRAFGDHDPFSNVTNPRIELTSLAKMHGMADHSALFYYPDGLHGAAAEGDNSPHPGANGMGNYLDHFHPQSLIRKDIDETTLVLSIAPHDAGKSRSEFSLSRVSANPQPAPCDNPITADTSPLKTGAYFAYVKTANADGRPTRQETEACLAQCGSKGLVCEEMPASLGFHGETLLARISTGGQWTKFKSLTCTKASYDFVSSDPNVQL